MSKKCAFVAIVGRPNVGKSSLMNYIIGAKVAIVTPKPQTTRNRIMGVFTEDDMQLIFIDTPGIHLPKTRLGRQMNKSAYSSLLDTDCVVFVVDSNHEIRDEERAIISKLQSAKVPVVLALNKVDKLKTKENLLIKIDEYNELLNFKALIPTSAKTGDGVNVLKDLLKELAPESTHHFDEDMLSDMPERAIAGEIIREKLLILLNDEVPHGIMVDIEKFSERKSAKGEDIVDIEAYIYCERESHKGIIIGKKGALLKTAGTYAREDMEEFFGVKINLNLWVKVRENWRNHDATISKIF